MSPGDLFAVSTSKEVTPDCFAACLASVRASNSARTVPIAGKAAFQEKDEIVSG
jgi:hypothetical protein